MQSIKYFSAAYNDIKHSKGWFGKVCLLALLSFVPIFGQIVVNGYLYGWAREIAWGVHEPLPQKIFDNRDGKLYRRGFYLLVFNIVLILLLNIVARLLGLIPGMVQTNEMMGFTVTSNSLLYSIITLALSVFVSFITWAGIMRISIYDRLSAGFQFKKDWKMVAHNPSGLWRIFFMVVLWTLLFSILIGIVFGMLYTGIFVSALGDMNTSYTLSNIVSPQFIVDLILTAGPSFIVVTLLCAYVSGVAGVFVNLLEARALGFWTMQFDVPHWRGQDEPLPFEMQQGFAQ